MAVPKMAVYQLDRIIPIVPVPVAADFDVVLEKMLEDDKTRLDTNVVRQMFGFTVPKSSITSTSIKLHPRNLKRLARIWQGPIEDNVFGLEYRFSDPFEACYSDAGLLEQPFAVVNCGSESLGVQLDNSVPVMRPAHRGLLSYLSYWIECTQQQALGAGESPPIDLHQSRGVRFAVDLTQDRRWNS